MSTKTKKPVQAKGKSGKKSAKPGSKPRAADSEPMANPGVAEDRFVKDLLVRGEAAKLTPDGKLPQRATHVIASENKDGSAVVRRARFKLF
jgi:hypothetical protein